MRLEILPVPGLPEIRHGDDLAALIVEHVRLHEGDVVVIAQKVVSKAEGRVVRVDPRRREEERRRIVEAEAVRVLARRDDVLVVQTSHGYVCANAGVDASNVPRDALALLPSDPDASAALLRGRLKRLSGVDVGVIVSDTFGRPWRTGQTNVALGVAGIRPLRDHRGEKDAFGQPLRATLIAVADELAGATELVMGKSDGIPVAIVRGLEGGAGPGSASELVRPLEEDLFAAGGVEILELRRTVRDFRSSAVPDEVVLRAVQAAALAPVPGDGRPWRFVWLRSPEPRERLLEAVARASRRDLMADGLAADEAERRVAASHRGLREAPVLLACFVSLDGAMQYVTGRHARAHERAAAERDRFLLSTGAAVENLMVALAARGVGSWWSPATLFSPLEARDSVGLDGQWTAVGCVAAGYPRESRPQAPLPPVEEVLEIR